MGGEGSGRRPDPVKQLMGFNQPAPSIPDAAVYLPNLSGVLPGAKKTATDVTTADTLYIPQFLYGTDVTPPAASTVPIGTIYIQYTP